MRKMLFIKRCTFSILFMFVFSMLVLSFCRFNISAASITYEESQNGMVEKLRYGYNVAGGLTLAEGAQLQSNPILKPIDEGLYKYIVRDDNNSTTVAGNFIANSAVSIAEQSNSVLGAGVEAKVQVVNMDIATAFNKNSSTTETYSERYETYYQKISKVSYYVQGDVDFRDYLTDAFRRDLLSVKDKYDGLSLLQKYGTHIFTGYQFGGLMEITSYMKTNDKTVDLSTATDLSTKMSVAYGGYGGGTSFSFSEQYINGEQESFGTSNYKFRMFGGTSVTAVTLDHLFTYNASITDGKGNYMYDRWVQSINDGVSLAIVGHPNDSRNIPLWDLLPSTGYNTTRSHLIQAYAALCGDKYQEFLEKYPTVKREIGDQELATGAAEVYGYSVENNDYVTYYEDNNNTGVYNVGIGSTIYMNYIDTIPCENKEWKLISGSDFVEILDNKNGIFEISSDAVAGKTFKVELYNGETLLYDREFTLVKTKFSGGEGTEDNPYLIATHNDIDYLMREQSYWNKYFKLVNNIDLDNATISCIGNENKKFSGVFDGNYFTISNVKIQNPNGVSLGLFSYNEGTIKNLTLKDVSVGMGTTDTSKKINYAGSLVGYNVGTIENCKVENTNIHVKYVPSEDHSLSIGGLVGYSDKYGIIKESCVDVSEHIVGDLENKKNYSYLYVGGLVGKTNNSEISNCYVHNIKEIYGDVSDQHPYVYTGGLIGFDNEGSSILKSVVGKIGYVYYGYEKGVLISKYEAKNGALIGKSSDSTSVSDCFITEIKEKDDGSKNIEVGVSHGFEKTSSVTLSSTNLSYDIWTSDSEGFPILQKQIFDSNNALIINYEKAQTSYYYGEEFNISGVVVEGKYKNIDEPFEIKEFSFDESNFKSKQLGNYVIKISAIGFSKTYSVTVRKIEVIGLYIEPLVENYYVDYEINSKDFKVYYILENGDKIDVNDSQLSYINYPIKPITLKNDKFVLGDNEVTFTCGDIVGNCVVEATEREVVELIVESEPSKNTYKEGEKINLSGLVVKAIYSDKSSEIIPNNSLEIIGEVISAGDNEVLLAYGSYVCCKVNVFGEQVINEYTVEFRNWDGSLISTKKYLLGDTIEFPSNPTRPSDGSYIYEFEKWDNNSSTVTGNMIFTAVYLKTENQKQFLVIFKNWDGSIISSNRYNYGENIIFPQSPVKPSDAKYNYDFDKWDNDSTTVTGDMIFNPIFKENEISKKYTVIFKDWDGKIISLKEYNYGDVIIFPSNPTRQSDGTYNYTFDKWNNSSTIVSGDITFIAIYNQNLVQNNQNNQNNQNDHVEKSCISCGFKKGSIFINLLSLSSLFVLVLKKKD